MNSLLICMIYCTSFIQHSKNIPSTVTRYTETQDMDNVQNTHKA